ncbi:MAG: endo,4-beta-xylanase precursor [Segetibacter sp.]|nr:endo,4-beta-xylanase precursor [Segetibacter sp.]
MKNILKYVVPAVLVSSALVSCKKDIDNIGILNTTNYSDTSSPLKSAATFPVGFAIESNLFMNNSAYRATVLREANSVTFGNEMKQSSILQGNGTYNFTTADALFNAVNPAGITVFGHVLGWHQQQSAGYLKSFAGITVSAATELLTNNAGFEAGLNGWSVFNTTGGATVTANTGAADAHSGTGTMKVVNPVANPGNQWRVQVSSAAFSTTPGKQYAISYWVKATAPGGSIRLSSGPTSPQYQGDQTIGTSYQQVTWTITASLSSTTILFDLGQAANTYFIDDVSVKEVVAAPSGTQIATKVDQALSSWITTIVQRYAGKIKAWDVINELFTESGAIRNNVNTVPAVAPADMFVWSEYLGRDYALKAFNYAKAADPSALLFINDYNLESNSIKLDSLIAYVKELQARGAKVDGIGTQMHMSINTTYNGIDAMFQKLAASGLLVRVSELDVRVNPGDKTAFSTIPTTLSYQADMYKYVVNSYLKNVPAAQRHGITIWGVDDPTSWLYKNGNDYPLLFDRNFAKKPAYGAVLQALRGQ